MIRETSDWDAPLPPGKRNSLVEWKYSLSVLSDLHVSRPYAPIPSTQTQSQNLCIFCDASIKAIAAVAYLRTVDTTARCHIEFIMGKAKLAPHPEHTVLRLELCAAVLAVELAELITSEMDIDLKDIQLYTDSKVVSTMRPDVSMFPSTTEC